jgi:hypothetical protein
MRVVDDIHRDFERGLGMDAGACGIAAQRKYPTDLDGFFLRESVARQHQRNRSNGNRGGTQQPENTL